MSKYIAQHEKQNKKMKGEAYIFGRSYHTSSAGQAANIMAGPDFRDGFCKSESETLTHTVEQQNIFFDGSTFLIFLFFRELARY